MLFRHLPQLSLVAAAAAALMGCDRSTVPLGGVRQFFPLPASPESHAYHRNEMSQGAP